MLIVSESVSRTVDAINAAAFEQARASASERRKAAAWFVARQGVPGATRELTTARSVFERAVTRKPGSSNTARRRHALALRVLERV